jgi:putative acetyltransferase
MKFEVRRDDLSGAQVQALLREHMAGMMSNSPPESVHALPLDALRRPEITFWSVWLDQELCGCGALKALDDTHGEVKSMRTRVPFLRHGVGQAALDHILTEARARGYQQLHLETGSTDAFKPAHALYLRNGFEVCGPFGDYTFDPFSVYMVKSLR